MSDFLIITLAVFADVLFPGPNFILCSSIAINSGYKKALQLVYGIILACIAWCIFLIIGVVGLFKKYPMLKSGVKLIGGIYLILIGLKMLFVSIRGQDLFSIKLNNINSNEKKILGRYQNFAIGFFNCILNPEVGLFYMVMFTRVIDKYGVNYKLLALYSIDFIAVQLLCFVFIAMFFARIANKIYPYLRVLNVFLSFLLLYLSSKLLISILH
ncbi:MAG: Leucine efflux protein [Pseudomonadota bacterium]|jgi:threonine/homoserine/homoserine lactone efflux protein